MPEPFMLAGRAWIPVASATGQRAFVRLCDLTSPHPLDGSTIERLASGRADCDTALAEFLIGLLSVALGPADLETWQRLYESPPPADDLEAAFAPFAEALMLDGDGPRFFQDRAELEGKPTPVEALFIDTPADHFLVDRRYEVLSRTGAAIALLTLQTMAPSGGAGHRTSLRGGGPLTTFALPCARPTLWQFLWANVPLAPKPERARLALVMPWLAPTRTSPKDGGVITTPEDGALPAQAYFGMPRRIRLNFVTNNDRRPCDLTGEVDDVVVRDYITRPWGVNYPSSAWRHPSSPYYKQKKDSPEFLPVHLKSSRIGYRDWLGLVSSAPDNLRIAANIVDEFRKQRARLIRADDARRVGLLACGYALDSMKPLDFGEAQLPLFATGSTDKDQALDDTASGMIDAAEEAAAQLTRAIRQALYGEKSKVDAGSTVLSAAALRFWSETEAPFYALLRSLNERLVTDAADAMPSIIAVGQDWLETMRRCALAIYDDTAPLEDSDPERLADVITARKFLSLTFTGSTPAGRKIYAALVLPEPDKPARGKKIRKARS